MADVVVVGVLKLIVATLLFLLVAGERGHHNKDAIVVLNVLLGWTFLGWVIALVWACTEVRRTEGASRRGATGTGDRASALRRLVARPLCRACRRVRDHDTLSR
jgi:uncharacterized membrane protein YqaE (UPF0057 family)